MSACGLFHLGRGRPSLDAPTEAFVDAGGHLGWAMGTPLHAALGPYGSGLLLLAVGMLGLVVLLHTHVSTIGSALGIVLRRGGRTILHSWQVVVGEGPAPSPPMHRCRPAPRRDRPAWAPLRSSGSIRPILGSRIPGRWQGDP